MNYKNFPDAIWKNIESTLQDLKSKNENVYAAFDADGTLWDTDLGETFFHYQIDQKLVELPADPWNHYQVLKTKNNDPREAYLWLAQINQSQKLETVREWANQAYAQASPVPVFSEQKKLISLLQQNGVEVFVVTASVKWAVEPGARALGIPDENVIGVETEVQNGIVTPIPRGPITYRAGKAEALLNRNQGRRPFLSSGNTVGDLELLLSATHLRLAVSAASRDDRLFKTESELLQKSMEFGWMYHRFI